MIQNIPGGTFPVSTVSIDKTSFLDVWRGSSYENRWQEIKSLLMTTDSSVDLKLNELDSDGKTPLASIISAVGQLNQDQCIRKICVEVMELMLKRGADPNVMSKISVPQRIFERVNNTICTTGSGFNDIECTYAPLHTIASSGFVDLAFVLLKNSSADLLLCDSEGKTASELASDEGHQVMVNLLAFAANGKYEEMEELVENYKKTIFS